MPQNANSFVYLTTVITIKHSEDKRTGERTQSNEITKCLQEKPCLQESHITWSIFDGITL